jgi:hypothetical protein
MKAKRKHVLSREQLRKIAKKFDLVLGGTIAKPKLRSKKSHTWVVYDQISDQYKSNNWREWMQGEIAAVVATAIEGNYPHPDVVKSIEVKINRLL